MSLEKHNRIQLCTSLMTN